MPPRPTSTDEKSPTEILPLQEWLKLLTARGVDMRIAMTLASKIYASHNTKERLGELNAQKLSSILPDKEGRKSVLNAVKGIASGKAISKKRTRDSDLLEPLQSDADRENLPSSLEFHEILDPEALIPVTCTTNRAPVKTAWVYTVARKLNFDVQEALSIAHVYVHFSSLKHALMLGNILNAGETREAEAELRELPADEKKKQVGSGSGGSRPAWMGRNRGNGNGKGKEDEAAAVIGSSQPWVGILKASPVIERADGTWRGIQQGVAVQPSVAYLYITRAFKESTPHVMGALKLLADSYEPEELNRIGMHLYNSFKPQTAGWGEKATLDCATILDQLKQPLSNNNPDEVEHMAKLEAESRKQVQASSPIPVLPDDEGGHDNGDDGLSELSEPPPVFEGMEEVDEVKRDEFELPPMKKARGEMSLEEYEAMLDAEDEPGGYLEGGDIVV